MSEATTTDIIDTISDSLDLGMPEPSSEGREKSEESREEDFSPIPHLSPFEERALNLLGAGVQSEQVAATLGVTPARISQLLAESSFAEQVQQKRFDNLHKHTERDTKYDAMEDRLLEKLDSAIPLMVRPDTILKAISTINGAKRRGSTSPDAVGTNATIVSISMPKKIVQQFATNINNQIIKAGEQELLTISSDSLLKQVEDKQARRQLEHHNDGHPENSISDT